MRNYVEAYLEAFQSGYIQEKSSIKLHIEQQAAIDELLMPKSTSFFHVVEPSTHRYHFMGKQQVNISGYSNEEFMERGVELFLQSLHPDEVEIIIKQIYAEFSLLSVKSSAKDREKIQFQYNFRLRRKDEKYISLIEQAYILEVDQEGRPALILGNVITLGDHEKLPVRASAKLISDSGFSETIFSKTYQPISNALSGLTDRELDILRNLAAGKTSKQIGDELYISPHTVDTHRRNLLKKLDCRSVVELARFAYENGLL